MNRWHPTQNPVGATGHLPLALKNTTTTRVMRIWTSMPKFPKKARPMPVTRMYGEAPRCLSRHVFTLQVQPDIGSKVRQVPEVFEVREMLSLSATIIPVTQPTKARQRPRKLAPSKEGR